MVIKEYYERGGVNYAEDPRVEAGYLIVEFDTVLADGVSQLAIDYVSADEPDLGGLTFRILPPPPPGVSLTLPDRQSKVAELWEQNGGRLKVVADVADRLPATGSYRMLVWPADADDPAPLAVYHIVVDQESLTRLPGLVSPLPASEEPTLEDLRNYAVSLINDDRADFGAPPVKLGTNPSAQRHADDALAARYYVGHWTVDGMKPYMLYTLEGGHGIVAENAAGNWLIGCEDENVYCRPAPVAESIAGHEWGMMYDDAHANWGHRDTIINPNYDTVNIGIAWDESGVAFYQHFEYVGLTYTEAPALRDGYLSLKMSMLGDNAANMLAVYHDPLPERQSPEDIRALTSYCTGGGFTDDCDDVTARFYVLRPPEPGASYHGLAPNQIVADSWTIEGDSIEVLANVGEFVQDTGVYTIIVPAAGDGSRALSAYSIFLE